MKDWNWFGIIISLVIMNISLIMFLGTGTGFVSFLFVIPSTISCTLAIYLIINQKEVK